MYKSFLTALVFSIVSGSAFSQEIKSEKIKTRWAKDVSPGNVWKEYPRPQLQRNNWINLNGLWEYAITKKEAEKPSKFDGKILIPFAVESALSGVNKPFLPTDRLWYKKTFSISKNWNEKNIILHFGAVDYEAAIWINKKLVGTHKGGFNPFSFDITPYLNSKGEQLIEVSVTDPTDSESFNRGKQKLDPKGIWYTPVSGIWQTVWIEPVNKTFIENILPETNIDNGTVTINSKLTGASGSEKLKLKVLKGDKEVFSKEYSYKNNIRFNLEKFDLWDSAHPNLYQLELTLSRDNKILDEVKSYFAMRKVAPGTDEQGYKRVYLNNRPVFQYGPLDQGWWPDGLLTPPSAQAMLWDMVKLKEMGFNTIRKHIKIEPALYYYYADSLGLMLWQDMPSGFATERSKEEHIAPKAENDWNAPKSITDQWILELNAMIDQLRFFPSITTWVVFNEGWGQFDTKNIVNNVMEKDKSRIVNGVTGWVDREVSDVIDIHNYPSTAMVLPQNTNNRISSLGEFGGLGLPIKNHLWNPEMRNWGYKNIANNEDLTNEYTRLTYDLQTLIAQGLASAIYTQTTDVEGEVNGLITYDREEIKIPVAKINTANSKLYHIKSAKPQILISDARRGKITHEIKLNNETFKDRPFPFVVNNKSTIRSIAAFNLSSLPESLSLWLNLGGDVVIKINGQTVFEQTLRETRDYNQYNISDKAKALKVGINTFEIEYKMNGDKTAFDYGLTAF